MIVITGIYYALGLAAAGAIVAWLANPWFSTPLWLLAAFCLYFFRDPDREIPPGPVAVSPADGKVVAIKPEGALNRISIFLNVFDVHVNRSPVAGTVRSVDYREGAFMNAMKPECGLLNEQTLVVIDAGGYDVSFKQIAGLLARRIVCKVKPGDRLERGQRVGMIKFGSRTDVLMPADVAPRVTTGMRVKGGSTVLAVLAVASREDHSHVASVVS